MSTTSLVSRLFCRRFTVAAAGLLLTAAPAAAGDWLGFRGNDGSGVVGDVTIRRSWSEDEGIAWKVDLPGR